MQRHINNTLHSYHSNDSITNQLSFTLVANYSWKVAKFLIHMQVSILANIQCQVITNKNLKNTYKYKWTTDKKKKSNVFGPDNMVIIHKSTNKQKLTKTMQALFSHSSFFYLFWWNASLSSGYNIQLFQTLTINAKALILARNTKNNVSHISIKKKQQQLTWIALVWWPVWVAPFLQKFQFN